MRKLLLGTALATCSVLGLQASNVAAQGLTVERISPTAVGQQPAYAVKFLCGGVPAATDDPAAPGDDATHLLGPGNYLSTINILSLRQQPTGLRIRVVESLPGTTNDIGRAGPLTPQRIVRARRAIQIDCVDILGALAGANGLQQQEEGAVGGADGLQAAQAEQQAAELEVVAVYSHTPFTDDGTVGEGELLTEGFLLIQRADGNGAPGQ